MTIIIIHVLYIHVLVANYVLNINLMIIVFLPVYNIILCHFYDNNNYHGYNHESGKIIDAILNEPL